MTDKNTRQDNVIIILYHTGESYPSEVTYLFSYFFTPSFISKKIQLPQVPSVPTLFTGSLSYQSLSHSVGTGRREPWEGGCFSTRVTHPLVK